MVNNELYCLNSNFYAGFFAAMPPGLKELDLSYNELHRKHARDLGVFLSHTTKTIESLRLCGNGLSRFNQSLGSYDGKTAFDLKRLDVGENGLLLLPTHYLATFLSHLSATLNELRICEKGVVIPKAALINRFSLIPDHIDTLSFSDSDLLGLSVFDFVEVLDSASETVSGLDLSFNRLNRLPVAELAYLLGHLAKHYTRLKLSNNGLSYLSSLSTAELKTIFSALSPHIGELDVSSNGLEGLTRTE